MENMSLQRVGLVGASLPLVLPSVSAARYRNTLGDQLCLGGDMAQRKEAMSLGTMVSDFSGGPGKIGQTQRTSPKSWVKAFYIP